MWTIVPVIILLTDRGPIVPAAVPAAQHAEAGPDGEGNRQAVVLELQLPRQRQFRIQLADRAEKDLKPGQPRLLTVDNELVVPVNKIVHVLVTGADVIHAFAVPSFGIKIDAVPGRINETWFKATREGLFHGQCSELCGKNHAFMPISVRVVSESDFNTWVNAAKKKYAGAAASHRDMFAAAAQPK